MKNPKTSNSLVPPTFKDSKHLQQTQSPYTPSSKFTDAIRISYSHYRPKFTVLSHSHSHYKPKFTQYNNWNLSSSLSEGWLKVSSLFKSIAEMTKPLVVRFVKSGAMGLIWVWDRKRLRLAWSGLERCCDKLLAVVWLTTTWCRASDSRARWWNWIWLVRSRRFFDARHLGLPRGKCGERGEGPWEL